MMARGRGQSQSLITLPCLKLTEKGCHPVHCHSHRTRLCRPQPQRDADRAGRRGQANALSVVMARHAGIEPTWAHLSLAAQILCPAAFSRVALWKESFLWAQRGKIETLAMRAVSPAEHSAASAWDFPKHDTHSECHPRAGETCTSYNDGAAFATTPWNLLFCEALWIDTGWLQRMTESASWSLREILIWLLEMFQRRIPASAKSLRRREFIAEEKKSEMRWQAANYIARHPSHFGGLWRAA